MEGTIVALDRKGRGVIDDDRGRIVVPFTVPGDSIRAGTRGKRKGVRRALLEEILTASPDRVAPPCPYAGTCGGCPWQMIDYAAQLRFKRDSICSALDGLAAPYVPEVVPCPELYFYRNRMDYVVGANGELGLKASEQWWNVLNLTTCLLLSEEGVELMRRFRAWMIEHSVAPWEHRTHRGFARYLVIREGKRTGERMVMIVTAPGNLPGRENLIARFRDLTTSILWGINPRITDLSIADDVHVLSGNDVLHEQLLLPSTDVNGERGQTARNDGVSPHIGRRLTFAIPPNAFFQTNTVMAERLVEVVRDFASLSPTDLLIDLYCGVGLFGIALAPGAGQVIGVESDPRAVAVAQRNAVVNKAENVRFVLAKSEAWPFPLDPIDCCIVDPPRSGLHPKVIDSLLTMLPTCIVYVSCNPTALARDLVVLAKRYAVDRVQPLDLFPHTYHVETVVRLTRRSA